MHEDDTRSFLRPGVQPVQNDEESGLPAMPAADYKPWASPANKPVFAIHCIRPDGQIRSFQYMDLDSDSRYEPGVIALRFTGTKLMEVIIHGRNLWRLYDGIHRHVIRWVMESSRDFAKDGEAIVSRIEIRQAKQQAEPAMESEELA